MLQLLWTSRDATECEGWVARALQCFASGGSAMERSGTGAWTREVSWNQPLLPDLVEWIVAISDETDDQWEIDDRVAAALRGGSTNRLG